MEFERKVKRNIVLKQEDRSSRFTARETGGASSFPERLRLDV
jgi:hypothetical protein